MSKNVITVVNFVRSDDPREDPALLFSTFQKQRELCSRYGFPHTFLMQYDALAKPHFVSELLDNPDDRREIGVWIEMAREQVERVGLTWHGRPGFNWDWHVNPGFLMAYTQEQRKLLIDELFRRFKETFGYYPKSVGSWLLDTWSVTYMTETYGVDAFCLCKEQYGTDGYTLWGGYYNQGYYPSRRNLFVPAQTAAQQLPSPVFRMLGPDPIYQYDSGRSEQFDPGRQSVLTMEPCWSCGQDPRWVDWFLHSSCEEESLGFSFSQTGQENSFLWTQIGDGLTMQFDKIAKAVAAGTCEVLTLGDTARWFKQTYPVTPSTAMTALTDWREQGRQSVWYNSRRYRLNWMRENGTLFIRDIHLFDERYTERYLTAVETSDAAVYDTLPLVDSFCFSGKGTHAAWYLTKPDGTPAKGRILQSTQTAPDTLTVTLEADGETLTCRCEPETVTLTGSLPTLSLRWHELGETALVSITATAVTFRHGGMTYGMTAKGGTFAGGERSLTLTPTADTVTLGFFCEG